MEKREITPIAHIRTDFPEKFGIPRQSGLVPGLRGEIIFEEGYRNDEGFHISGSFSIFRKLTEKSLFLPYVRRALAETRESAYLQAGHHSVRIRSGCRP